MVVGTIICLTILTYGGNALLYWWLHHKKWGIIEKFSIWLGTNMTMLFLDGIFLFLGKVIEDFAMVE